MIEFSEEEKKIIDELEDDPILPVCHQIFYDDNFRKRIYDELKAKYPRKERETDVKHRILTSEDKELLNTMKYGLKKRAERREAKEYHNCYRCKNGKFIPPEHNFNCEIYDVDMIVKLCRLNKKCAYWDERQ